MKLSKITFKPIYRISTGIVGVDQVLNGGLVHGSLTLLVGSPGAGKTTLAMQMLDAVAVWGVPTTFISTDMKVERIDERADELGLSRKLIVHTTDANHILRLVEHRGGVLVVDGLALGTMTRPRDIVALVKGLRAAAKYGATVVVTSITNKKYQIAGPLMVDRTVDVVLEIGSDNLSRSKWVSSDRKNRFVPSEMLMTEPIELKVGRAGRLS